MTKGQRFKELAKKLMPNQDGLLNFNSSFDSYSDIDDEIFRDNEYLGGMAAVIIELLKQED